MVQSTLVFFFNWSEQVDRKTKMQEEDFLRISLAVVLAKKASSNLTRNLTCASLCDQWLIFSTLRLNSSKFELWSIY